jgi:hypothetical protein
MKISKRLYLIAFIAFMLVACELPPTLTATPFDQATPTLDQGTPVFTPTLSVKTPTKTPYDPATPTLDQETPSPTETATSSPTPYDPTPTQIVAFNTLTPTPPATATAVPSITPSHTPDIIIGTEEPIRPENILCNPSFEGIYTPRIFGEVHVAQCWEAFYSVTPYTPEDTPDHRRPEFKKAIRELPGPPRVSDGEAAQQLFCFFGVCEAGVHQTFATVPGLKYGAAALIQLWSEDGFNPGGKDEESHAYGALECYLDGSFLLDTMQYTSDECDTNDDRINAQAWLAVDLSGGTFAFPEPDDLYPAPDHRPVAGWAEGCYDRYCEISLEFVANSYETTVFFGVRFMHPFAHNNFYIDSAIVAQID